MRQSIEFFCFFIFIFSIIVVMKITSSPSIKLSSHFRRLEVVEAFVILRRHARRWFVHAQHLLGTSEDDSASSGVCEVRVLASPQQAIPMGRGHQELVPCKLHDVFNLVYNTNSIIST